jgi:hypothetical protein
LGWPIRLTNPDLWGFDMAAKVGHLTRTPAGLQVFLQ